MKKKKKIAPTTHSEVLWHFSGGPTWNKRKNLQNKMPKPAADAFAILIAILKSKTLRIGGYHELIKVTVPQIQINPKTRKIQVKGNITRELSTSPVCCVADIPEAGLPFHAQRYGKFAIGFRRSSIIKASFNPVFYTFDSQSIANSYLTAYTSLKNFDSNYIEQLIDGIRDDVEQEYQSRLDELEGSYEDYEYSPVNNLEPIEINDSDLTDAFNDVDMLITRGLIELKHLLSYVKTFSQPEFETIYAEREWRSLKAFNFKWSDIDSIILPKKGNFPAIFEKKFRKSLGIPNRIKIKFFEEL